MVYHGRSFHPLVARNFMTLVVNFKYPTFPDNTLPKGRLPREKEAQACWYYYILCEKQRSMVGKGPESQVIVVDTGYDHQTPWHDKHYWETAKSIGLMYQVDINDMFHYWPAVRIEALRLGLPEPEQEYMNPARPV